MVTPQLPLEARKRAVRALLLATSFAVTAAVAKPAKVDSWKSVLKVLNQAPASRIESPYSNPLGDDLLARYDGEMKAIERAWDEKKRGPEERERKNRFFHEKVAKLNEVTMAHLETASKAGKSYRAIARKELARVMSNPVASVDSVSHYDPSGQIGFCFGRALLVHYRLLRAGVKPQDLAKIFIVGDLMVQKRVWRFHTAVMVRDPKDGYLVVDPLQGKLMGYRAWMKDTSAYEMKHPYSRARFYVTDPRKFLPSFGEYAEAQIDTPVLKSYFSELLSSVR